MLTTLCLPRLVSIAVAQLLLTLGARSQTARLGNKFPRRARQEKQGTSNPSIEGETGKDHPVLHSDPKNRRITEWFGAALHPHPPSPHLPSHQVPEL